MSDNSAVTGRKVFFLYPHSVIQNDVFDVMIANEYEVYPITDHRRALHLFRRFNDSIVFINIDDELTESEWESYVCSLMSNDETSSVRIGILTYHDDLDLAKKYLMELMVPCGFTRLKLGLAESVRIILTSLQANEAKGRRKFVRASTQGSDRASFNVRFGDATLHGRVWDISVAGMAITFDRQIELPIRSVLQDIQLKLWGMLLRVNGVVTAPRSGADGGFVVMFGSTLSTEAKQKIHSFVHRWLSQEMEQVMASF